MASSLNSLGILTTNVNEGITVRQLISIPETVGFRGLDLGVSDQSPSPTKVINQPTVSSIPDALGLPSIRMGFPSINLESFLSSVANVGFKASAAAKGVKRIRTSDCSCH